MIATQLCLPSIIESGKQKKDAPCAIIHIGSILSSDFGNGLKPVVPAYIVSKQGQRALNHCLFEEVKQHGIKCCCIMPGYVRTPMMKRIYSPKFGKMEDFLRPSDISKAVMFVLNSSASACPTDIVIRSQKCIL